MSKNILKIKRVNFFLAVLFFLAVGVFLNIFYFKIVDIGGKKFIARLALGEKSRERGLSGKESLCPKCSMLFEFENIGRKSFWMKGMKFDLDIIWINDSKIVYIKKNFSHESSESIDPGVSANKVLEIGAGLSDEYGFKIGDKVRIF